MSVDEHMRFKPWHRWLGEDVELWEDHEAVMSSAWFWVQALGSRVSSPGFSAPLQVELCGWLCRVQLPDHLLRFRV